MSPRDQSARQASIERARERETVLRHKTRHEPHPRIKGRVDVVHDEANCELCAILDAASALADAEQQRADAIKFHTAEHRDRQAAETALADTRQALGRAATDIAAVNAMGWDSMRRELAATAIDRIEAALAAAPTQEGDPT